MKKVLAAYAVAALLVSGLAPVASARTITEPGTGKLAAEVEAVLASLPPGDMTTVVVTLREQTDLSAVHGATPAARLKGTITALQAKANSSQVPIRGLLRAQTAQGSVAGATPLWISNAISVTATAQVIRDLAARSDVAGITPDQVAVVPTAGTPEPNLTSVAAPALWDLGYTGAGVVVASLDSGVDVTHPDLASRWRGGTNSWYDPYGQNATPTDFTGHGTAITGVMVGGDAGGTSIGMAPGARWIAAKIFNNAGGATATAIHQAFQWVLDPDRDPNTPDAPQVVNGSWSIGAGPGCDVSFQPDLQALRTAGILPVFAAGNYGPGGSTSVSPANYPEALAIGAVNNTDLIYSASSRGPSTCGGRSGAFPDLVAPGVDVLTTDRYGLYQTATGTSMSAPHASGALALLLSSMPGLSADRAQAALTATAFDLGPAGPDPGYGYGRVDVLAAYQWLQAQPDFGVVLAPGAASVTAGGNVTYTVQITPVNGFSGDVSLSLSGLSTAQADWTFTPAVVPAGSGTSELMVTTSSAILPGTYPLTVTASSGPISRTVAATLTTTLLNVSTPLYFSTLGSTTVPGVIGTADDADVYNWSGTAFSRSIDASATPYKLPGGANVDGFDRVSATSFYLSFTGQVKVPGIGNVQDEDVVFFNGTAWSLFFDGSVRGLTGASATDLDGISIVGGQLYFSTDNNALPPGAGGTGDDADIYRWNGASTYTRVIDASAAPYSLPAAANVDGFVRVDDTHFYLSFSTDTTVPGLGAVQDEDVVFDNNGIWSVYFDGTAHGLTAAKLAVDAFDVS